ncbi:hypothetical protein KIL84_009624 [Mauremys mutica]|uniref:Uncharacterized protein n=1 Tax=Mauremys mutica TaxID=74926 RepID=A0A9D3XMM4_9SAUR|nr:hypothetical protein KIL84_009624 [Mauremys mutica]
MAWHSLTPGENLALGVVFLTRRYLDQQPPVYVGAWLPPVRMQSTAMALSHEEQKIHRFQGQKERTTVIKHFLLHRPWTHRDLNRCPLASQAGAKPQCHLIYIQDFAQQPLARVSLNVLMNPSA